MRMTPDELEYAISQYVDGNLPPLELAAVEERLASDAEARALLEEYRKLKLVLKRSVPAAPNIAWDRLAVRISKSLEDEEIPIRHFSIASIGWAGRLAIAAALLFAISVAIHFAPGPQRPATGTQNEGIALVSGPTVEQPNGPVLSEISIGPSPTMADRSHLADQDIVARPTVVLIDRAVPAGQDNDQPMY